MATEPKCEHRNDFDNCRVCIAWEGRTDAKRCESTSNFYGDEIQCELPMHYHLIHFNEHRSAEWTDD